MKYILTLTLSLLLLACTATAPATSRTGLHTIPPGSILKLHQPLTIPALQVKTGVQYGEATAYVNSNEPYCEFEVNTIAETATILPAGDYRITRVLRYEDPFYSLQTNNKIKTASAGDTAAWRAFAMSQDTHWTYTTVFRLESMAHPDIRQLVCGSTFFSGFDARHITISEFETLAGDVMSLQLAGR